MAEVRQAWESRQERVRSAHVEWTESKFVAAESVPFRQPGTASPANALHFVPEHDITLERVATYQIRDQMMRYDYAGQVFNPSKGGRHESEYKSVSDGNESKNFFNDKRGDQADFPRSGVIRDSAVHWDYDVRNLLPLAMAFRPCDEDMGGVNLDDFTIADESIDIDRVPCYLIRRKEQSPRQAYRSFWVAPLLDFHVVRVNYGRPDSHPIYTLDVVYDPPDSRRQEWVPWSWTLVAEKPPTQETLSEISAQVEHVEINADISPGEFRFNYPPGTAVTDLRTNSRSLIQESGKKRAVTKNELSRGATYQDLLTSESGEAALGDTRTGVSVPVMIAAISLIALIAGWLAVHKRSA